MITLSVRISFLLILVTTLLSAQSQVLEFAPNFTSLSSAENSISIAYDLPVNMDVEFIGISAFESLSTEESFYSYRTATEDQWSSWVYFYPSQINAALDRRTFETEPIYKKIQHIQFRSNNAFSMPTFRLFLAQARHDDTVELAKNVVSCSCALPSYCDRSCWCPNNDCAPQQSPAITQPTHVIVHHSAGFTTSSNFANVVAYYYDLHVNTNGWDDIGYNWLVDPNGIIYEGRGSLAQGAHFSCMNGGTTGICMIGNYVTNTPSTSAIASLEELIAWELCDKGLDPTAIELHETSELFLPTICGHRDGNNAPSPQSCASGTECPGEVLYSMLPSIRDEIAANACLDLNVGINEVPPSHIFSAYPNPFSHTIRFQSNIDLSTTVVQIVIYNSIGQHVYHLTSKKPTQITLDLPFLPSGIYTVQILSDLENMDTYRIIKE